MSSTRRKYDHVCRRSTSSIPGSAFGFGHARVGASPTGAATRSSTTRSHEGQVAEEVPAAELPTSAGRTSVGHRSAVPGFGSVAAVAPGAATSEAAVLALLTEQPMHGYQIITELESRSQGAWRPSPGSVYPTLQALEDQGLVRSIELDGRKVIELTVDGRIAAQTVVDAGTKPWEEAAADVGNAPFKMFELVRQVGERDEGSGRGPARPAGRRGDRGAAARPGVASTRSSPTTSQPTPGLPDPGGPEPRCLGALASAPPRPTRKPLLARKATGDVIFPAKSVIGAGLGWRGGVGWVGGSRGGVGGSRGGVGVSRGGVGGSRGGVGGVAGERGGRRRSRGLSRGRACGGPR